MCALKSFTDNIRRVLALNYGSLSSLIESLSTSFSLFELSIKSPLPFAGLKASWPRSIVAAELPKDLRLVIKLLWFKNYFSSLGNLLYK